MKSRTRCVALAVVLALLAVLVPGEPAMANLQIMTCADIRRDDVGAYGGN